jgi:tripartite-type tricarboxylate transporter receptor subunit TctC
MKHVLRMLLALCIAHGAALAQECAPALRIVVGQSAGGGADAVARLLAQGLNARLGMVVLVENRTGAANNIAAQYVARAPKDGCTLLLRGTDHLVNTMIYTHPGYELKEFVPVARLVYGPLVIVANPQQPFRTLANVVEYARSHPGKLSYSATSAGSGVHVPMELFLRVAGIQIVHVPYKGAALSLADTAAGVEPLGIGSVSAAQALIQAGRLRPLAVLAHNRWGSMPEVPTMTEAGFAEANVPAWLGLFAPTGTPLAVRERLNRELQALLQDPALRERLVAHGWEASPDTIQDFARFLDDEERVNRKLIDALQLKVE